MSRVVALASALLAGTVAVVAQEAGPPALQGVGIEQRLRAQVPLDLVFRDETGRPVELQEYFGRKPVVLDLVYYDCPMLCKLVQGGLVSSLRVLSFTPGREFEIVTVSIDPGETPQLAAAKKERLLEEYGRPAAAGGWHFLTGSEASIRNLAEAVGFRYTYDPTTDLYAHAAGIMVLTAEGKLARYLYGVEYAPRDLRLALVEASRGRIGSLADQVLLYCYKYDPATGRYGAFVINLVRLGGLLTVACLGTYVLLMRRRDNRLARRRAVR